MIGPDDEDEAGYASPPCLMHELDPAFRELRAEGDVVRVERD